MECSGVLPTTHTVAYRKGLGTCDGILYMSDALQSALEIGQEAVIVQIDFSAAFIMIIILLLLKPAAQAQVGKTKLILNCFRNPTSTCATEN